VENESKPISRRREHVCRVYVPVCVCWLQYDIEPPIYATGWLMTLFARGHDLDIVFELWDFLFRRGDPVMVHFVALALVISNRSGLKLHDASVCRVWDSLVWLALGWFIHAVPH